MEQRHTIGDVLARLLYGMLLTVAAVGFLSGPAQAYTLPGTGQTQCYSDTAAMPACPSPGQDYYGQDANYKGTPPSYRNNGDGTISDLVTGLQWQQAYDEIPRAWDVAGAYCQDLGLGGHTDWRLPSRKELLSIVNEGFTYPPIDPVFTCTRDAYWSATARTGYSGLAWYVEFILGGTSYGPQTSAEPVRCVRGDPLPESVYRDNLDGTVTDQTTGLVWEQAGSPARMNWKQALAWCQEQSTAGKTDWRLPNKRELESLVVDSRTPPVIDPVFTEPGTWYWASTSVMGKVSYAWYVHFYYGDTLPDPKDSSSHVRCVRGGPGAPNNAGTILLLLDGR